VAHRNEVDITKASDTAERAGATGDPVIRKPTKILQGSAKKYDGTGKSASRVIKVMAHIEECLWDAPPACAGAFSEKMSCAASGDPRDQEQNAMMETAQQLYEQYTQSGAPSLALMDRIREAKE
jgi:hypothetical protein